MGLRDLNTNYYLEAKEAALEEIADVKDLLRRLFIDRLRNAEGLNNLLRQSPQVGVVPAALRACDRLVTVMREQRNRFAPKTVRSAANRPVEDPQRYAVARLIFMEQELEKARQLPERLRQLALSYIETDLELASEIDRILATNDNVSVRLQDRAVFVLASIEQLQRSVRDADFGYRYKDGSDSE